MNHVGRQQLQPVAADLQPRAVLRADRQVDRQAGTLQLVQQRLLVEPGDREGGGGLRLQPAALHHLQVEHRSPAPEIGQHHRSRLRLGQHVGREIARIPVTAAIQVVEAAGQQEERQREQQSGRQRGAPALGEQAQPRQCRQARADRLQDAGRPGSQPHRQDQVDRLEVVEDVVDAVDRDDQHVKDDHQQ